MVEKETKESMYEFEIGRFQDLLKENQAYAFQRYGLSLFYSLPTEETFRLMSEFGFKNKEPLDYYNLGTVECQEGKLKEAMKHFEKAESMGCDQPELFFNIAVLYEEKEDMKKAKEYYQKYVDAIEKYDDIPKRMQEDLDEVRQRLKTL